MRFVTGFTILIAVAVLPSCAASPTHSSTAPTPGPQVRSEGATRIAVVDVERILDEAPQGRDARRRIEELEEGARQQMRDMSAEMERLDTELQELKESEAGEARVSERERQLSAMRQRNMERARHLEQRVLAARERMMSPLLQEVSRTSGEIARAEGFGIVLDKHATPFATGGADLTDRVLARLSEAATGMGAGR